MSTVAAEAVKGLVRPVVYLRPELSPLSIRGFSHKILIDKEIIVGSHLNCLPGLSTICSLSGPYQGNPRISGFCPGLTTICSLSGPYQAKPLIVLPGVDMLGLSTICFLSGPYQGKPLIVLDRSTGRETHVRARGYHFLALLAAQLA